MTVQAPLKCMCMCKMDDMGDKSYMGDICDMDVMYEISHIVSMGDMDDVGVIGYWGGMCSKGDVTLVI